jgi:hypothetical protein
MQITFHGSVSKELDFPDNNEDAFKADLAKRLVVISDGASESFDAKSWAAILVEHFIDSPQFNEEWLIDAINDFSTLYNREELSWSKQASFDRGSFATLLGIELLQESKTAEILAVGDSIAVLMSDEQVIASYPYRSFEDFRQKPVLLSTNDLLNDFVRQNGFYNTHSVTWELSTLSNPKIFCMTDALGEWFLRTFQSDNSEWKQLLSIYTTTELQDFVSSLREEKKIKTDDTTLISISFEEIC